MARPLWKNSEQVSVVRVRSTELGPGRLLGVPAETGSPDDTELLVIESFDEKPVGMAIRGDLKAFADKIVRAAYGPDARVDVPTRYSWEVHESDTPSLIYVHRYGHGHTTLSVDRPAEHLQGVDRILATALVEHALGHLLDGLEPRLYRKEH